MRDRCHNPNGTSWKNYGGRPDHAVRVCPRWDNLEDGFQNFLADMGLRPSAMHEIDRTNNDGDYEPGNCRWVEHKPQLRNRRNNHLVTLNGKTQCVAAWCDELGIKYPTLTNRLNRGWTPERALTASVAKKGGLP